MKSHGCGLALLVTLVLASCASPAKLARQSNAALNAGDLRKAYDKALRAIEKDPQNQAGRTAYNAASQRMAVNYRDRVLARAATDTISAANLVFEARRFRAEVARHETILEPVADYERAERSILTGAARAHFNRGVEAMAARRPKQAVSEFTSARAYDTTFPGLASRLSDARRQATVRVAVIPFSDDVAVPGLSREIGDSVQRELTRRATGEFRFTQIVDGPEIERNVTLAELRNPSPSLAMDIGRRVGADWVIVGHFHDLHARSSERGLTIPLFHSVESKDNKGNVTMVRWEELSLRTITRQREVTLQFEFEVIDVATGAVIAHREQPSEAAARVAWTDFRPEQNSEHYFLLPPDVRKSDPERAKKVDQQWRDVMGSWDVQDFLHSARDQRARSRYSPRYRGEFYEDTRRRPAWLGELPSADEMAFVALHDTWRPVLAALKELDAKDP